MSKATRCHECGGSLLYMPAGYINGFAYCAACSIKNTPTDTHAHTAVYDDDIGFVGHCIGCGAGWTLKYGWYEPAVDVADYTDCSAYSACKEGENTMTSKQAAKAGSLAELDGAKDYFADKQAASDRPKFKVGDRVTSDDGLVGTISQVRVRTTHYYDIQVPDGYGTYTREEKWLEDAPLTPEEAWVDATLLIGKREMEYIFTTPTYLKSIDRRTAWDKETRHQAYVILGGAHIKIGENGGPVKTRVRALIKQAQQ